METKSKILVVEDERIVAEDIRRSLKKLGYEVSAVVSTGKEALRKVKQLRPDLVLMDIVLRMEMNGIQAAEKIRESHDIPVIYLTAYADEETLERAKKTEPYGYILKPFEDRELQTTIEMALYKHRTEKRIKENEAWLSTTLKSIAEGVIATNEKTEILFMNPVAETITGRKFGEVSGKEFHAMFQVIHPGRRSAPASGQPSSLRAMIDLSGEAKLVRKNGKVITVDIHASPIRNELGKVSGVVMAIQDVTLRMLTEEALKKSEQEKRVILSSVSDQGLRRRIPQSTRNTGPWSGGPDGECRAAEAPPRLPQRVAAAGGRHGAGPLGRTRRPGRAGPAFLQPRSGGPAPGGRGDGRARRSRFCPSPGPPLGRPARRPAGGAFQPSQGHRPRSARLAGRFVSQRCSTGGVLEEGSRRWAVGGGRRSGGTCAARLPA